MAEIPFDRGRYALLKEAVDGLSGICDGAEMRDEQGFDGTDTRAGHLYAFLPLDAWPLSAFHRAWRWAKKYRRQLEKMQLACTGLPEPPPFTDEHRQIAVQPDTSGWFVIFPYDDELKAAFRTIPGQHLHSIPIGGSTKVFFRYRTVKAVPGAGAALRTFAEQYQFQYGPGVENLAVVCDAPGAEQRIDISDYRILMDTERIGAYALYFPRDAALNEEVKRLPGCSYSLVHGFHWVLPARATNALLEFVARHPQFSVSQDAREHLQTGRV